MRDAAVRAAARNELQLDAEVPGAPAHRGRRDGLVAGSTRRLRGDRGSVWRGGGGGGGGGAAAGGRRRCDGDGAGLAAATGAGATAGAAGSCRSRPAPPAHCRRLRPRCESARSRPPSPGRSCRRARSRVPTTGDGISTVALSVITSASVWSSATASPGFTCQATSSTSAMPSPMSGILITCTPMLRRRPRGPHRRRSRNVGVVIISPSRA